MMTLMPELTTDEIVDRLKLSTGIKVEEYTDAQISQINDGIRDLVVTLKSIFPLFE